MSEPVVNPVVDPAVAEMMRKLSAPVGDQDAKIVASLRAAGITDEGLLRTASAAARLFGGLSLSPAQGLALARAAGVEVPVVVAPAPRPDAPVVRADGSLDLSGVPEAERSTVEMIWRSRLEVQAARDEVAAIRSEAARKDMIAALRSELGAGLVGATVDQVADALIVCAKADAKAAELLRGVLKTQGAVVVKSEVLRAAGQRGPVAPTGSAVESYDGMIRAYMNEHNVTRAAAVKALRGTPKFRDAANAAELERAARAS